MFVMNYVGIKISKYIRVFSIANISYFVVLVVPVLKSKKYLSQVKNFKYVTKQIGKKYLGGHSLMMSDFMGREGGYKIQIQLIKVSKQNSDKVEGRDSKQPIDMYKEYLRRNSLMMSDFMGREGDGAMKFRLKGGSKYPKDLKMIDMYFP